MKSLSITTAWGEATAFVKNEAGLLLPVALALIVLPAAFLEAIVPRTPPGVLPEPGLWLGFVPIMLVAAIVGHLTISILALGRERVVGDAITHAVRRFLPLLGASLLFALAAVAALTPFFILSFVFFQKQLFLLAICLWLVLAAAFLFLWVRSSMITPVAAMESGGPVAIIRRSWLLTQGHAWKLVGLLLAVMLVALVLSIVFTTIGGILVRVLAGEPEPGSLAFFFSLLPGAAFNTLFTIYFLPLLARIYAQLAR